MDNVFFMNRLYKCSKFDSFGRVNLSDSLFSC
ncbi:hypothetical protein MCP1_8640001 [Candidatus Terasakiella magnetica]|nr:hypothetical protein MCP1_8640001 [Candidatus Terasakiella magnetica]